MSNDYSFPKKEHLCGEIRVARLFAEGKAFIAYPLRIVYRFTNEISDARVRVVVGVPKKRFKHAVDRNRLKRQIKEAYRLNKQELTDILIARNQYLEVGINYISDDKLDYATIDAKMKSALHRILKSME